MYLGEEIPVFGEWFSIHFIENPGMAFGMEFGGEYGKLFLTLFRIFAVMIIGGLLIQLSKRKANVGLIVGISLILAGALGNIIDSIFYGVYFSESSYAIKTAAQFMPEAGGYAEYFKGKVVDMLHFNLISGYWPQWMPFVGGNRFEFFRPIFNIADSSISLGIVYLLIFQRSFFTDSNKAEKSQNADFNASTDSSV